MFKKFGWSIIILCTDCKQERESEKIVKCISFEILISSNASWIPFASAVYIVASFRSRTDNTSWLITAAAATLFLSFEPSV